MPIEAIHIDAQPRVEIISVLRPKILRSQKAIIAVTMFTPVMYTFAVYLST